MERDDECFYDALLSVIDVESVQERGHVHFWMALVFQFSENFVCRPKQHHPHPKLPCHLKWNVAKQLSTECRATLLPLSDCQLPYGELEFEAEQPLWPVD